MLEKYDEFAKKKKDIDKKIAGLKRAKLQVKIDKFNQQRQLAAKKMNTFVNGASSYS